MSLRPYVLVAALAASTAGIAQTADFGLQGGLTFPMGDMTHIVGSDLSLALGAQFRFGLRGGHALVTRVDYVSFSGRDDSWVPSAKVTENLLSIGLDYNYYFSRRVGQGFYLGGGLGYLQKDEKYAEDGYGYPGGNPSQTKNRLYLSTGLGVAFNKHVSLFGRFQFFFDNQTGETYNASTDSYDKTYNMSTLLTVGVEYHF